MSRACVITGIGCLGSFGLGRSELAAALARGEPVVSEVERSSAHDSESARLAHTIRVGLEPWADPRTTRRLSPASRYAVAAARMALDDAGLEQLEGAEGLASVHIATALGPASATETLLSQIFCEDPESASPLHFMESVANAPAAQVAIALGAHGPNSSVTQREAGGLLAVHDGVQDVLRGRVSRAIAGSVDELTSLNHAIFDRLHALARPTGSRAEMARPFDRDRDGFVMSEGATIWLLEEEDAARARGATILGHVIATVRANDPTATSVGWGTGAARLASRLSQELERQGIDRSRIDRWVSGASGSRAGDALEARVIREFFLDEPLPSIITPKAYIGEYGGGFLAGAALAIQGAPFASTPGFEHRDPELDVTPHDGRRLPRARRVILSSLAAGGAAVWLVVDPA
ncbi:MAG: hypothetical protein KDC38_10225 [Planctomycetes bacterium]|nr:hypothetical protein [Planctomycetota bacterium]